MNINIDFFSSGLNEAIGAGVYKITIEANGKSAPLYIGESVCVLVRCAAHLFALSRNYGYFGLKDTMIHNPAITLKFELVKSETDAKARKIFEKQLIRKLSPISQSKISDRMKGVDEKIEALEIFLNQT